MIILYTVYTCLNAEYFYISGRDESFGSGEVGMTHAVVMMLVEDIRNKGHHVYMDNFYTSPALFAELRQCGFGACGTLRTNRRGIPPSLKEPIKKGEIKATEVNESMMAIKWMDKRPVTVVTTIHNDDVSTVERRCRRAPGGREEVEKPVAVIDYNKYMAGFDMADQLLPYYGFAHCTVKWWRRAFFYLLDMAVVNSYVLYTLHNPDCRRRLTHEKFIVTLATDLLMSAGHSTSSPTAPYPSSRQPVARLAEHHFLVEVGRKANGRAKQRDCAVCSDRKGSGRKTTIYKCRECNMPMCVVPCFELHHTKRNPEKYL